MLSESPLFWFEYEIIEFGGFLFLAEVCVYWDGSREVVEMVRLQESEVYNG